MVNVAHCIHGLGLGGAQQIVKWIVRLNNRQVFRHHVYSSSDGVFREEIENAGATVRIVERKVPKFDPLWVATLSLAMRRDKVHVVHTHLFGDSLHGYLASQAAGRLPTVMTLHNMALFHTRLQRLGYRWLLPRVTRSVACSETVRESFLQEMRGRPLAIETIHNGIGARAGTLDARAAREKLGCGPSTSLIAGIGRLVEQKGFAYLMPALAEVQRAGDGQVRLVLLGDGPMRAHLEAEAHRHGVFNSVSFAGFRPDVPELLAGVDVVVISSIEEGLPVALLEAMAAGRCIVATNVGGIGEAIRHEKEGILVPPREPAALAAAIRRVLADAELRHRLGRAACDRFRDSFAAERMVESYQHLYCEVHASRHGAGRGEPVGARAPGA